LSLHDGFAWLRRGRRIKVGDAECPKHGGSALGAAGNATLGAGIAESDIDDAHRFEGVEGVGGREIEACSLEFLFDGAMDEEGERGNKDVRLDSMVGDRSAACRSRP
jgi:hypothetical protein